MSLHCRISRHNSGRQAWFRDDERRDEVVDVACRKEISAAWLDGHWAEAGVCEGEARGWRYNVKTVWADHPFWACYVWSISHGSDVDSGSNPNKVDRLALSAFQTCKAQGRSPDEVRGGEAFSYILQVANAI